MTDPDHEYIREQKINRLAELLEQVLVNIALSVLHQVRCHHDYCDHICYKLDCPKRNGIPF